jgi:ABC-type amino acid transport substrate-binding protein
MKRFQLNASLVFCALLTISAVSPGGPASHCDARSLEEIKASGELRVCIAPTTPAYAVPRDPECREECAFTGPVYREVMAFVGYLGNTVRPVFRRVGWDEQFHDHTGKTDRDGEYTPELLATGKCDLYPSHLTKNDWRLKKIDFALFFPSRMMVIIHKSRKDAPKNPADLAGKIAAAEENSSFHTWLMEQNETTFAHNPVDVRLMGLKDGLAAVEKGNADFTLVDADIALWEASHSFSHLCVAFPVGPKDEIGWAFARKDQDLADAVRSFFESEVPDEASELNRIWKEEFGVTLVQFQALIQATK